MSHTISSNALKALRKQRLWSQEELAVAAGISLRTVQRAEGDGVASSPTLKALAATLQVEPNELLIAHADNRSYLNIQFGYVTIGVMLTTAVLINVFSAPAFKMTSAFWFLLGLCAVIAALFATLTTRVDGDEVRFYMGLGLIGKKISASDIIAHRVVRNKVWWGWGVRLIPGGWLYNVSGLDAVEISLNSGKVIRIGSDEAQQFAAAISKAKSVCDS